ncbi:MAG: DNA-binding response regulator [Rhodospirillales bacterium]|jgi:two-component system OmpR family response regulator|nr:DNA-binding response regulator [Rhodospirillales bacterium]
MSDTPERRLLDPEAHLLVVEDDGEMRTLVSRLLREAGFRVSAARDGREMWELFDSPAGQPDLVLLDVMLPGTSGLDLLRRLRERGTTPVMMLTARGEEVDRVLGLELGADDYVAKPFAPRELVARVRSLLRRASPAASAKVDPRSRRVAFAGWTLDMARRELLSPDGVAVDLSGAEYDMLLAFLEHPQRVLSREQLMEVAKRRAGADPFDRTVDVQVGRLRRKIEPDEASPSLIKTVRGAGYVLVADVTPA